MTKGIAAEPRTSDLREAVEVARQTISDEAAALQRLHAQIDGGFSAVLETILSRCDQLVVSGIGKSGNIAQKIAATLTSTGTSAVFMHPVEALHGDLGLVRERHWLLALSRSGNTEELVRFVAHFRRLGGGVIAMTQAVSSRLAELADHVLLLPDVDEAGPLNLAPTTSCVLMLALGDALAMALLHARGFRPEDFAQFHPEGTLGRRLLLRAADVMHRGDRLPIVRAAEPFDHALVVMTNKSLGLAILVDETGRLLGVFTDGDLRRLIARVSDWHVLDARSAHAQSRRSADAPAVPISTVTAEKPAIECLRLMRDQQITSLVVIDEHAHPIGLVRMQDLVNAGLA